MNVGTYYKFISDDKGIGERRLYKRYYYYYNNYSTAIRSYILFFAKRRRGGHVRPKRFVSAAMYKIIHADRDGKFTVVYTESVTLRFMLFAHTLMCSSLFGNVQCSIL